MFKNFRYSFLIFLFAFFSAAQAHALSVNKLRLSAQPDKARLVLDLSDQTDFRVFLMDDPYRIAIDLPDLQWKAGNLVP